VAVFLLVIALMSQTRPDVLIALARDGWAAARAAAQQGGTVESLAPARRDAAEIEKLTQGTLWHLQGEYARALISAAIAAAQNEHGELDLQLAHARSMSERLATSTYPARWPLAIDEAEGELYLSVYRYADAARAFVRAGKTRDACDAYRRAAKVMTGAAAEEATRYLTTCK
jgi:hypothetical protein